MHVDPGIAIVGLSDLVGHHLDVFLHHIILKAAANQALDREQGVMGVGDGLPFGGLAHQDFVVAGESNDGRRGASAFAVFYHSRAAAFENGNAGISGTEVYAYDSGHGVLQISGIRVV